MKPWWRRTEYVLCWLLLAGVLFGVVCDIIDAQTCPSYVRAWVIAREHNGSIDTLVVFYIPDSLNVDTLWFKHMFGDYASIDTINCVVYLDVDSTNTDHLVVNTHAQGDSLNFDDGVFNWLKADTVDLNYGILDTINGTVRFKTTYGAYNGYVEFASNDSGNLEINGGNYQDELTYWRGNVDITGTRFTVKLGGWWNQGMDQPGWIELIAGFPDTTKVWIGVGKMIVNNLLECSLSVWVGDTITSSCGVYKIGDVGSWYLDQTDGLHDTNKLFQYDGDRWKINYHTISVDDSVKCTATDSTVDFWAVNDFKFWNDIRTDSSCTADSGDFQHCVADVNVTTDSIDAQHGVFDINITLGATVIDSIKVNGTDLEIYVGGDETPFKASQ
jgi:hypothetical protein